MFGSWRQEHRLGRAEAALGGGHPLDAARLAGSVDGATSGVRAAQLLAAARLAVGDLGGAETALATAARRAPNDWSIHRDRAVLLQRLGDRARAQREIGLAVTLNPRLDLPPGFVRRGRHGNG